MAKAKFDGVIEAARYTATGELEWVRAYLRRGATFSDHVILPRQALVDQLKAGKRFETGQRVKLLASTFKVDRPVRLIQRDGKDILVAGEQPSTHDRLEGVPIL